MWLQMAWTFHNDRKHWTDERLSAMINAVPRGHMELIDYVCESDELYRHTKAFYGAPFIWDYLGNFGGNTHLVGPINKINQRLATVMNDAALTNFVGVGATLEGLNNPAIYEMLFDRVWAGTNMNLATWVNQEARARAGGPDTACEQAWQLLRQKILLDDASTIGGHGVIFQERNPALRGEPDRMLSAAIPYANADLFKVWNLLLQAGPPAQSTSSYQRDLADTTRQALGNLGSTMRDQMADAYDRKDAVAFARAASQFMSLGTDIDQFLGTRSEFLLGKWIDDARSWAANDAEQAYYERNARSIITIWGGGRLTDYAGRQWNGLLRDYYLPRWQLLIDARLAELKGGPPVNRTALEKQWRAHDLEYATTTGGQYPRQPSGDLFALSRELYNKYAPLVRQ
jgi:alpha-N-acetylglucosaminidase